MTTASRVRLALTAGVHNVFPRNGGTLWLHTPYEDRVEILRRFPQRTDLDLNAPYEGHARPTIHIERRPQRRGGGWLDHTAPKDD